MGSAGDCCYSHVHLLLKHQHREIARCQDEHWGIYHDVLETGEQKVGNTGLSNGRWAGVKECNRKSCGSKQVYGQGRMVLGVGGEEACCVSSVEAADVDY